MQKKKYPKLKRTREIVSIFIAYGFSDVISRTPILRLIGKPLGKLIFRNREGLNEMSRGRKIHLAFEELGTTFIKLAQILSSRHDLLPKDITDELASLQDHVKPFADDRAISIIESELNEKIENIFETFDYSPIASASISQVYRGKLKSGEVVAVKVKRPEIDEIINVDIEIMLWIAEIFEKYIEEFRVLRPVKLIEAFSAQLKRELDLSFEKNNMQRFERCFQKDKNIKIAKSYSKYSTKNMLTMEFIDGVKVSDIKSTEGYDGKIVVDRIAACMLEQIFSINFFHADPHPGNILVLKDNVVCFLDFGMVGVVPPAIKTALGNIISSLSGGEFTKFSHALLNLCDNKEIENFEDFDATVYTFVNHYIDIPISEISIEDVFNEVITILREHKLSVNPQVMLMAKSAIVLEGVGRVLDKDFKVVDHISVFANKYFMDKIKPESLLRQIRSLALDYYNVFKNMPSDIIDLICVLKKGSMKISLEHKGLNVFAQTLDRLADRLSYSIVLASLIISSALIISAKIPPLLNGIPVIGMIGFGISGILGFAMLVVRLIKNYFHKK